MSSIVISTEPARVLCVRIPAGLATARPWASSQRTAGGSVIGSRPIEQLGLGNWSGRPIGPGCGVRPDRVALGTELDGLALTAVVGEGSAGRDFRASAPAAGGRHYQSEAADGEYPGEPIHQSDPP